MKYIAFLIIIVISLSCQEKPSHSTSNKPILDTANVYKDLEIQIDSTKDKEWKKNMIAIKKWMIEDPSRTYLNSIKFKVNGISVYAFSKENIEKSFGKPIKYFEPNYECGFLSSSEQDEKYYSYQYNGILLTGNDEQNYVVEELDFSQFDFKKYTVEINGSAIDNNTTVEQLRVILKDNFKLNENNTIFLHDVGDDNFEVEFKDNKISKIQYWSPC